MTDIDTMNKYADFWRNIGFNVLPSDGKVPIVQYKQFEDKAIPQELHDYWKKIGKFKEGITIMKGRLWNYEHRKNIWCNLIDCDNEQGTKLICNVKGVQNTPESMTKTGVVVENTSRGYHFIVFRKIKFPTKAANASGIEVKDILTVTPTTLSDGTERELIGESMKALEECVTHDEFVYHINDKLKQYGIDYLNGKAE